jgi:hypothetical protein
MILYAYPVSYSDFSIPQALPDPVGTVPAYTPQKTDPVPSGHILPPGTANNGVFHNFQKKCA